ncbi:MAG: HDOD domain-containing protein [Acidobacteriia bacterium]|nr:HDOD domain-containing protein [Terriglobia bacterium]
MKRVETVLTASAKLQAKDLAHQALRYKALQSLGKLPPLSPILNKLMVTLSDKDVSFSQLSDLIEKDTILAGNVLGLVNSAPYRCNGAINSVRHAVSLIGLSKLRNVATSLSFARLRTSSSAKAWFPALFSMHSAATAILADLLAAELPVDYPEGAFTAGLLQNVGMMLIALGLPEERIKIQENYCRASESLSDCERDVLGFDHADLSAEVLHRWNLPEPIQLAVLQHHSPGPVSGQMRLAHLLGQADLLAAQIGIVAQPWLRPAGGSPLETLEAIGLSPTVMERFQTEYEAIRGMFR